MTIRYFKDYIDSINEGLVKTYPGKTVLKNILNSLKQMSINATGKFKDNKIQLSIKNFNLIPLSQINHLFEHIDTIIINRGGWFPSNMNIKKLTNIQKHYKYNFTDIIRIHDEIDTISIEYESKFDTQENPIPNKLYHLTIKEYSKKIKRIGLIPKSKSKLSSHLDRIYLCITKQDCIDLIPKMMFYYTGEKDEMIYKFGKKLFNKDLTPVIYEIDNSSNLIDKLYVDPNYTQGYYTLCNIPPDKIKIVSKGLKNKQK